MEMKLSSRCLQIVALSQFVLFFGFAQTQKPPRVFLSNPGVLANVRTACLNDAREFRAPLKQLMKEAEKALMVAPVSVTEKSQVPPSGDKHDYMSLARYYWPDPKKADGLPYISRDGEVNPEIYEMNDYPNQGTMVSAVSTLALAYYLTGGEHFAEHAVKLVRTWFVDSATHMNPNFNFAQGVKGASAGRPSGLIESRGLTQVIDAIGLLGSYKGWTDENQKDMINWFDQFLAWMQTSKLGQAEAKTTNNHGVWYDVQVSSMALFVGKRELARKVLEQAKTERIAEQIEPDGSQPRELARTTSKHYVAFNLEAFFALASIGSTAGIDLWNYQSNDGRSIRKAFDWVIPYLRDEKAWTHKQIKKFDPAQHYPILITASVFYNDESYAKLAFNLAGDRGDAHRVHLLLGK
jgi:hypothetical protein